MQAPEDAMRSVVAPPVRTAPPGWAGRRHHASDVELYSWLFVRVSGVLILFLVFGHVLIMHIVNDVAVVNYAFVAERWATPFWRTYDWLMLTLALSHGVLGMRVLIYDYVYQVGWRVATLATLYSLSFIFLLLGSLVILTFQPV
jgi:succinate dehydrogenase / fumarate reductase membrane anchor subunit